MPPMNVPTRIAPPQRTMIAPQQVKRQQELADLLLQQGSSTAPVQSPMEGLARALTAGVGGYLGHKAGERDSQGRANDMRLMSELLSARSEGESVDPEKLGGFYNQELAAALAPELFKAKEQEELVQVVGEDGIARYVPKSQAAGQVAEVPEWMNPAYRDWRMDLAQAGRSSTNINMPEGESEFLKQLGKLDAERLSGWQNEAASAAVTMQIVDDLRGVLENTATGRLEPAKVAFGSLASSFGLDPASLGLGDITNAQQLQALANELVLGQAGRLTGVLSESDMALLRDTVGGLGTDWEANQRILRGIAQRSQFAMDRARAAETYARENSGLTGFSFAPAAPVAVAGPPQAPGADVPGLNTTPQTAPAPSGDIPTFQSPSDPGLLALPSGATFYDSNGQLRIKP